MQTTICLLMSSEIDNKYTMLINCIIDMLATEIMLSSSSNLLD